MIYFDHTYTLDMNHKFHKRLQRMGFVLDPTEVEHPGKQFCRFILLRNPKNPRKRTYLEFIHVGRGGEAHHKPGISFGWSKELKKFHAKLVKERRYKAKYFHKNYDWKTDSRAKLPGWNFLMFQGLQMPGLFPWLTEYEPSPKRKRTIPPKHRNGVHAHKGFELELNKKDKTFFEYILGQKLKPVTRMKCGTELYVQDARRTKVKAVVLKAKSVSRLVTEFGAAPEIFAGRPAGRIKNPSGMWDIIII